MVHFEDFSSPEFNNMFLNLPDDLLLRLLRTLVCHEDEQKAANLRDAWNVAITCQRLYTLTTQLISEMCTTGVHMEQGVPFDIVRAVYMPQDVVQGTLMALRVGAPTVRSVHLGAMNHAQLQSALDLLRNCPLVTELVFVDVKNGVMVPHEVASGIHTLTIVSPQLRTLKSLYEAKCKPKNLKLLNFDRHDGRGDMLHHIWSRLTSACISVDLTQVDYDVQGWEAPLTDEQLQGMRVHERSSEVRFEVPHTTCIRAEGVEEGRFSAETTMVTEWIDDYMLLRHVAVREPPPLWPEQMSHQQMLATAVSLVQPQAPQVHRECINSSLVVLHCECEEDVEDEEYSSEAGSDDRASHSEDMKWKSGSWYDISSAHDFVHLKGGKLVEKFVEEKVGANGIDTLLVTTPPASRCNASTAWVAAISAARLAEEAGKVRVLAVSAAVFQVLKDVRVPECVRNIGVVDEYVSGDFVRAIPWTLMTLARQKTVEAVWMGDVELQDEGSFKESTLRRAINACRYAEGAGVCATGMRGKLENWLWDRRR